MRAPGAANRPGGRLEREQGRAGARDADGHAALAEVLEHRARRGNQREPGLLMQPVLEGVDEELRALG